MITKNYTLNLSTSRTNVKEIEIKIYTFGIPLEFLGKINK